MCFYHCFLINCLRILFIYSVALRRFAVNLRYFESGGDVAFHFNPRLSDRVVVRNSNLGGSWGPEEKQQPSFPFVAGYPFQMIILCEQYQFKVRVGLPCLRFCRSTKRWLLERYLSSFPGRTGGPADGRIRFWSQLNNSRRSPQRWG